MDEPCASLVVMATNIRGSVWHVRVARRLGSLQVIETFGGCDCMVPRDSGAHSCCGQWAGWFIARGVAEVAGQAGHEDTVYQRNLGVRWENGYCESFHGKLRDEFLNGEIFYSLKEAQILTERWRVEYNTERPHSALGYRPPAPQAILPKQPGHGDMENTTAFSTSPHPRRRLRTNVQRGVTLTFHLVQKIGQVTSPPKPGFALQCSLLCGF